MMFTREEDGSWQEHEMYNRASHNWLTLADFMTDERGVRYQIRTNQNAVIEPPKDIDLLTKTWHMKTVAEYQYWLE